VDIVGPDGKRPLSLKGSGVGGGRSNWSTPASTRFISRMGRDALIAVNPDRRESNLAVIPEGRAEAVERQCGDGRGGAKRRKLLTM